jgi:hypothetical protein
MQCFQNSFITYYVIYITYIYIYIWPDLMWLFLSRPVVPFCNTTLSKLITPSEPASVASFAPICILYQLYWIKIIIVVVSLMCGNAWAIYTPNEVCSVFSIFVYPRVPSIHSTRGLCFSLVPIQTCFTKRADTAEPTSPACLACPAEMNWGICINSKL